MTELTDIDLSKSDLEAKLAKWMRRAASNRRALADYDAKAERARELGISLAEVEYQAMSDARAIVRHAERQVARIREAMGKR